MAGLARAGVAGGACTCAAAPALHQRFEVLVLGSVVVAQTRDIADIRIYHLWLEAVGRLVEDHVEDGRHLHRAAP